ncbi:hypothetical protein [Actinoallomurus iriomotensis]|uniref:Uncharacterized protein n=1 Tax=Actinoallomurus iriomotensis TaxID=478107 RepID=A0A9W6RH54_9ACTN|nr:hypothetical protein [Actinoallomurus iriomotensis]GLY73825.1 hypothetical protein Airi01_020920 [Actinoallomurus iriomotensis]
MSSARLGVLAGAVLLLVLASTVGWYAFRVVLKSGPGCVVTAVSGTGSGDYTLTTTQADNAATIAGVGMRMGVPDRAVSVALATAMQESGLVDLAGGDRDSAGLFQHSAKPDAYANWEPEARALASALAGERAAALSCHDLATTTAAVTELGTTSISGTHGRARGWAFSGWLVAHAARLGIEQVSFGGDTWTASSGKWSPASVATDVLSLREVADSRS